MSQEATTWVLSLTLGNATRKLVAWGLANHAHKDGRNAWCGVDTLAEYAECDRRTVQRHVTALIEAGIIREGDQDIIPAKIPKHNRPIVFDFAMDTARAQRWATQQVSGLRSAASSAGARGGRQTASKRWGDKTSPHAETPERGDNRGDNRGDTGVAQTKELTKNNQVPSSSEIANAIPDATTDTPAADLCQLLAALIAQNGSKRRPVTAKWLDAARLLLDRDGRDYAKAKALIEWCQADKFWRSNILSMPTFREKYDQLRLQALRDWETRHAGRPGLESTTDIALAHQALKGTFGDPAPFDGLLAIEAAL
jgi:hypothetical protein